LQNSNPWTRSTGPDSGSLDNGALSVDGQNMQGLESSSDPSMIQGGYVGATGQYPYWWGVGARPSWTPYGWRPYGSGWGGWNNQY